MNILILTDFSEVVENAGYYTVQLLKNVPVNFFLLNTGIFNSDKPEDDNVTAKEDLALKKLDKRIGELRKLTANKEHKFTSIYSENDLVNTTRRYIEEKKIDLIVMGAVRKGSPQNTILGLHTYEMIKKIKCNLLAVPADSIYKEPEEIILSIDHSAFLDKKEFKFFKQSGILEKSGISILEVQNEFSERQTECLFCDQLKNRAINTKQLRINDLFSKDLILEVQLKYDMIVLFGKNLSICDRLLHTNHGLCATTGNKLPILVLHD